MGRAEKVGRGRGQVPRYVVLEPPVVVQLLGNIASEYKDSAV